MSAANPPATKYPSDKPIILYDLPSKGRCACWSLNPWKTRMLLNYKNIPYVTEWLEYPDLKTRLGRHFPPNEVGPSYTSPTILIPTTHTFVMDSRKIATKLEEMFPSPSVHLDSPTLERVEKVMPKLLDAIRPIFAPLVPQLLLNPRSKAYFEETRQKALGMPLSEYAEKYAAKAYDAAVPPLKELAALLSEDTSGPYFLGREFSYADIVVASLLIMMDRLGVLETLLENLDEKTRLLFVKFYGSETVAKCLQRDAY